MGTGVGEAALAAEAIGAAEAAGAVAGGAGIAEAGLLGGEFAGGLGATGALTGGLGNAALLGGEFAGGLGSLAPAFQTAVGQTAAVMPEVAAQTAQFANIGAMPPVNAALGAGQIGDPALLAQQLGSGITNVNPAAPLYEMNALETADVMKHIDPNMVQGYMPMDTANAANMAERAQFAEAATKYPDLYPGNITPGGSTVYYPSGEAKYSFMEAPQVSSALEARAAAAPATPTSFDAFGNAVPAGSPAAMSADPTGLAQAQLEANAAAAAKPGFNFSNPLTSLYNVWKEQDPLTKGVTGGIAALQAAKYLNKPQGVAAPPGYSGPLSKFSYNPSTYTPYTYKPYAAGGPVEEMSRENAIGANTGYPQSDIQQGAYATPWQTPVSRNVVANAGDVGVDQMTGMERMAGGGIANLGGYSDGGRLLKGPGDGMSDNIPATIGSKQPARLADGEFVVPADVVSGLGNGSTDAGAKQLYKMLDKVRSARTGTKKQGKAIKPEKYTPA